MPRDEISITFKNNCGVSFLQYQNSRNETAQLFLILAEIFLCGTLNCQLIAVIAKWFNHFNLIHLSNGAGEKTITASVSSLKRKQLCYEKEKGKENNYVMKKKREKGGHF